MFPSFLLTALLSVQEDPPAPPPPPPDPVFVGDGYRADIDLGQGRLDVSFDGGDRLSIPLGLALRPSASPGVFAVDPLDEPRTIRAPMDGGIATTLGAALLHLALPGAAADEPARVSVGVRIATHGLMVIYGVPRAALDGVAFPAGKAGERSPLSFGWTTAGAPLRVAGTRVVDGVGVRVPSRSTVSLSAALSDPGMVGVRLAGRVGVDDSSDEDASVRLRLVSDGDELFDSGLLRRGAAATEVDVALREGSSELRVEVEPSAEFYGDATVVLDGLVLRSAGRSIRVAELLRAGEAGVDLLVGPGGEGVTGGWEALPVDAATDGPPAIDQGVSDPAAFRPPPLLLPFRLPGGTHVGVGLGYLPDATRYAYESGRFSVSIPAGLLARTVDEEDQLRVLVTLIFAPSRAELLERYRDTLVTIGASVEVGTTGGLMRPAWWRHPVIFAQRPPGRGRFARFDTYELEKLVQRVEQDLGLSEFTVVVDGPWNDRAGEATPSAEFESLRSFIAEQHVARRHVLLRWDPTGAAEGSFADISQVRAGDAVDATDKKRYRAFAAEVARRCLSDQLGALGADGLVVRGLERLRDPTTGVTYRAAARGVGLRELELLLASLHAGARQAKEDALLVAPLTSPHLLAYIDGILVPTRGIGVDGFAARSADLLALAPDVPAFVGPGSSGDGDLLRIAARGVALGVPSVGSRQLASLDEPSRKGLGAILSLASLCPLGLPESTDDGRVRLVVGERLLAETLPDDSGVVVYPDRDLAFLAVAVDGDVALPFSPSAVIEAHDAEVSLDGEETRLVGARRGVVYRFRF